MRIIEQDAPIEDLENTVRAEKLLKLNGILRLSDLINKSEHDLLLIPNLGIKMIKDIKENLRRNGLYLKGDGRYQEEIEVLRAENAKVNNAIVLTSDGKPLDPATKDWINQLADAIRRRCGDRPVMRMYAYRHCVTEYLAMDFDPTTTAPKDKIHGGFSITLSVCRADTPSLKLPEVGVFEIVLGVTNWVDALALANSLCQSLGALVKFNHG